MNRTTPIWTLAVALGSANLAEASQGFHSKFHEENVGKVMFTSEDNPIEGHDKRKYFAEVDVGKPVYFRAFLADAPAAMLKKNQGVSCRNDQAIFILADLPGEEKPIVLKKLFLSPAQFKDWTTLRQNEPFMGGSEKLYWPDNLESMRYHFLSGVVARLEPGNTTVTIRIDADCNGKEGRGRATIAKGELTIRVAKAAETTKALAKEGPFLHKGKHKADKALQPTMKKTASDKWKEDVILATTVSSDWKVKRHPATGKPIHRTLEAGVVVVRPKSSPQLSQSCRVFGVSFQQDSSGGQSFKDEMTMGTGQDAPFPCANRERR